MMSVFVLLKEFDVFKLEGMLFVILNERWFQIYKGVIEGCMEFSLVVIEDGSDDNVVKVLESFFYCYIVIIISFFDSKFVKCKFVKEKGKFFLRIVQMLLFIWIKFYGEKYFGLK